MRDTNLNLFIVRFFLTLYLFLIKILILIAILDLFGR